jgi:hypothetical protein
MKMKGARHTQWKMGNIERENVCGSWARNLNATLSLLEVEVGQTQSQVLASVCIVEF